MKRAAIILVIIVAAAAAAFFAKSKMSVASAAGKNQYKTVKAEVGLVKKTVSATGVLQPWTTVDIKSKAGGRVDAMLVDVGVKVRVGQEIAKIDPTDTQLQVDQAQADINKADAQTQQSQMTWQLQKVQSALAVETAHSAVSSAQANLEAAGARLQTARQQRDAQPDLTNASIASAQANVDSINQQLNEMRQASQPQDRANAQSIYDQAQANLVNADANLARQRTLLDKGYVSQQVVDQALAASNVIKAQVTSAKRKLDTLRQEQDASYASLTAKLKQAEAQLKNAQAGAVDIKIRKTAVLEAEANVKQNQRAVETARKNVLLAEANLANIGIKATDILQAKATKMRAQAGLTNATKTLQQTTVRAPTNGVVLQKYVEKGTYITSGISLTSAGANIVQLGDVTKMFVDVTVDETDIANVDDGQQVDVNIESYPGIPFEGKVTRIDPQAKVEANVTNIHVRVQIDNADVKFQLLKPGMNATCEFVKGKKENVLNVPSDAVRTDDQGKYVEVAQGGIPAPPDPKTGQAADPGTLVDCKVIKRYINRDASGQEQDHLEGNDSVEIVSGIKEGDLVVTQTIEPVVKQAGGALGGGFGPRPGGGGGRGR